MKHDAWNSFGDGETIELPIKIMQAPVQIAGATVAAPADWSPEVYDNTNFHLDPRQPIWNESDIGKYDFDLPMSHHH